MNEEFVPYEQALALKELGFDEPCLYNYSELYGFIENMNSLKHSDGNNRFVSAPLYQQVFRWFRKVHIIQSFIDYLFYDGFRYGFKWVKSNGEYGEMWKPNDGDTPDGYDTIEEAELECLKKLIELIKK
jgi:hypothetical protein